ncbi:MAG: fumarylacetoacetate hydrolase family protein [Pseudomonadota bacterium]|nr:fumarylacetoacetate hydrolase family protein [Pseudomonadota bacterium]
MKLGTLKHAKKLDGELVVVSQDNKLAIKATGVASCLREAVENWQETFSKLEKIYKDLNAGNVSDSFNVNEADFHSPLPRSFQWADGSSFLEHVRLVRKARNAEMPESLYTVPLMYQGMSDEFLAPRADIPQIEMGHGTDFEGEVGVITSNVPMGVSPEAALKCILLFVLINDVSLRGLVAEELAQGFGFFQSKPASAFAPFAITADELDLAWSNGRIKLPVLVNLNGEFFGKANAKEMHFHFGQLIAHAARTRNLSAGTIIGSGTVSNADESVGASCIQEVRMREKIKSGEFKTPFMKIGDTIEIKMLNQNGENLFGTILQKVARA